MLCRLFFSACIPFEPMISYKQERQKKCMATVVGKTHTEYDLFYCVYSSTTGTVYIVKRRVQSSSTTHIHTVHTSIYCTEYSILSVLHMMYRYSTVRVLSLLYYNTVYCSIVYCCVCTAHLQYVQRTVYCIWLGSLHTILFN